MIDKSNNFFKYKVDPYFFKTKKAYHEAAVKAHEQFKQDLIEEDLLHGFPKKAVEKAFDLAWEYGHEDGFNEVVKNYTKFIELVHITYKS